MVRHDELGDLQFALERMRQKLNETTITKNYLNTVLNSLSDAVLVTSPNGIVKSCNEATQRLLGYSEADLVGKPLVSFIDEAHRECVRPEHSAPEARETVLRTASGQTIPVSMASSAITTEDPQFQGNIYVARNITERKRAERRIRYLARYDTLTKMPNRMQFQHLLQQAIARARRNQRSLALLYLDLDRFKEVNDTFGHAAGDRTLEILSERLTRNLSKDTVIGRLAGDEFAMFIDDLPVDIDNRAAIGALARTLLDEISRTFYVNQQEVYLTASVGIAICPYDAENVIDLIRNADAAMYHSKQNGGNSCAFYVPEMNAAAVERLMLKSKLRRALERDELVILYQSKVDLRSGRVVGAEALLRWRLPGHGDISPSHFIPLAEETSLILDIGEWVLNRVCADYREWQKMRARARPHRHQPVAAPTEAGELHRPLPQRVPQARGLAHLLRAGSHRNHVDDRPEAHHRLLNELYAMGLNLAIDDFGTGYSSLSALQQFPIGTLKIDQSFVRDVAVDSNDAAIVRTIIDMGKSLDLEVIAEGVEASEQLEFLRKHGCYYAQGRLFGDAMEAGKLLAILAGQVGGAAYHARPVRAHGAAADPPLVVARPPMLSARDLTLRRGPEPLFEQVNFTVFRGNKVGITGANGAGKSSLFAAIRGELAADRGDIERPPDLKIAHVEQEIAASERAAIEFVLDGDAELRAVLAAIAAAERRDAAVGARRSSMRRSRPSTAIAPRRAPPRSCMDSDSRPRITSGQVAEFSGGWRVRLAMARALCSRADLLLLDEPTNHLDLDAIVWLEEWLTAFPGTLLMISHDREFLDAIIDRVLHIENRAHPRLLRQLLAVRAKARRGTGAAARAAGAADAAHRRDHHLRESLSRQRHQVAPGAEPLEDAASAWSASCRRTSTARSSSSSRRR